MARKSVYVSTLQQLSPELLNLIHQFYNELLLRHHYSELTALSYQSDLYKISYRLLMQNSNLFKADIRQILDVVFVPNEKHKTCYRALCAVRRFILYLINSGFIQSHPIMTLNLAKYKDRSLRLPRFLGEDDIKLLLYSISSTLNHQVNADYAIRDKAIFELMYATGMRVSELVNLQLHQLDFTTRSIRIIGKGNQERIVLFGEEAQCALVRYMNTARQHFIRHSHSLGKISLGYFPEWLFISRNTYPERVYSGGKLKTIRVHKPISRRWVDYLIKKYAYLSGLSHKKENISSHWLRHSFATHLLNNGANIKMIQTLLGHLSINATQVYTHIAVNHLKQFLKRFHPRENGRYPSIRRT